MMLETLTIPASIECSQVILYQCNGDEKKEDDEKKESEDEKSSFPVTKYWQCSRKKR